MIELKRIKDILPWPVGIFSHMDYDFLGYSKAFMDTELIALCGTRQPAPIMTFLHNMESEDPEFTDGELNEAAVMILEYYRKKWDTWKSMYELEYDPIHNFSDNVTENVTGSENESGEQFYDEANKQKDSDSDVSQLTDTFNSKKAGTGSKTKGNTRTDNLSENTTDTNQNNIYGFNSSNASGESNNSGTGTRTNTGTVTDNGTESDSYSEDLNTSSTKSESRTKEYSGDSVKTGEGSHTKETEHSRERSMTRFGNIGNISTQKLVIEEMELWRRNFIETCLNDVKNFITIPIYG